MQLQSQLFYIHENAIYVLAPYPGSSVKRRSFNSTLAPKEALPLTCHPSLNAFRSTDFNSTRVVSDTPHDLGDKHYIYSSAHPLPKLGFRDFTAPKAVQFAFSAISQSRNLNNVILSDLENAHFRAGEGS